MSRTGATSSIGKLQAEDLSGSSRGVARAYSVVPTAPAPLRCLEMGTLVHLASRRAGQAVAFRRVGVELSATEPLARPLLFSRLSRL
jgi:hypothetical protein